MKNLTILSLALLVACSGAQSTPFNPSPSDFSAAHAKDAPAASAKDPVYVYEMGSPGTLLAFPRHENTSKPLFSTTVTTDSNEYRTIAVNPVTGEVAFPDTSSDTVDVYSPMLSPEYTITLQQGEAAYEAAYDSKGNLYVSENEGCPGCDHGYVEEWNGQTFVKLWTSGYGGTPWFAVAQGVAVDNKGTVYVGDGFVGFLSASQPGSFKWAGGCVSCEIVLRTQSELTDMGMPQIRNGAYSYEYYNINDDGKNGWIGSFGGYCPNYKAPNFVVRGFSASASGRLFVPCWNGIPGSIGSVIEVPLSPFGRTYEIKGLTNPVAVGVAK